MKNFRVTFIRTIDSSMGKASEFRSVSDVKAKSAQSAQNKAFRKICFHTKFDHWRFYSISEIVKKEN